MAKPYEWLKTLTAEQLEKEDAVVIAAPPGFSWDQLAEKFSGKFNLSGLEFGSEPGKWRTKRDVRSGISRPMNILNFTLGSMPGTASWVMGGGDLEFFMGAVLTGEYKVLRFSDSDVLNGFQHFMAYEVIKMLQELGFAEEALPHLLESNEIAPGSHYCTDVTIEALGRKVTARVALSEDLAHAWKEKYSGEAQKAMFSPEVSEKIDLILSLEAGRTQVKGEEWANLYVGDFLLLDTCTVIPGNERGELLITVGGKPLFQAAFKGDIVQIQEHPDYQEEETVMSEDGEARGVEEVGAGSPSSAKNIPLTVTVEVGRIKMNLAQLMSLKPGSTLDLTVRPEDGVNLVINGTCVARGELLKLGEVLGVRITETG